ncbi:hypothetical protein RRG08_042249 [Elysia crispata]|uniref:Uncharacterized protein n=1 Tax=Elysia crispata TaxID=231223 RepID=A0AAE1E443_9GAST|nr:hypothetical protein RRG08_042249 [Elysia crispata]
MAWATRHLENHSIHLNQPCRRPYFVAKPRACFSSSGFTKIFLSTPTSLGHSRQPGAGLRVRFHEDFPFHSNFPGSFQAARFVANVCGEIINGVVTWKKMGIHGEGNLRLLVDYSTELSFRFLRVQQAYVKRIIVLPWRTLFALATGTAP